VARSCHTKVRLMWPTTRGKYCGTNRVYPLSLLFFRNYYYDTSCETASKQSIGIDYLLIYSFINTDGIMKGRMSSPK